jgi:hypothetical protein
VRPIASCDIWQRPDRRPLVHFLWPLSNYGFNGIRWEEPWFLAVNYGLLVVVLAWLWLQNRKPLARSSPALKSASTEPPA